MSEPDLQSRCQLLLAGAATVADIRSDHFLSELRTLIEHKRESVLQGEAEEQQLLQIMKQVGFAGRSEPSLQLFRSLRKISLLTDMPVLVTGETGTGKELVAAALHSLDSRRSRKPLLAVNCAALSQHLSESELFGHCRGAFTGAERERKGLFRSADGGVLFLDEVGELSQDLQSKLLRVLQAGRLRGVGADHEVEINVRVIAATNRCLERMVKEGTFREDLFHRLNVISLKIPPLRERSGDIEVLLQHFLEKHSLLWREKGRPTIDPEFVRALQKATLSGNVRQLENILCRALIDWDGNGSLCLRHLPAQIWKEVSDPTSEQSDRQASAHETHPGHLPLEAQAIEYLQQHDWNLAQAIRDLESILVRGAMMASGGNQSEAARLLGITPRSVYNKLHRLP
jgi:transcriptional regulator with GAF, ATPase, and Fis domain